MARKIYEPGEDEELLEEEEAGTEQDDQDDSEGDSSEDGADDVEFTPEQQAHIDKIIGSRLAQQKRQLDAQAKKEKERAQEEAEAEALREQEKFQQLAEKHEAKIERLEPELETVTGERDRYKEALEAQLETIRGDLPDYIITLLDKMDPVDQFEYIAENADTLKKKKDPFPDTPEGDNGKKKLTAEEKEEAQKQTRTRYQSSF